MQKHKASTAFEWTIAKLLTWTTSYFKNHRIDSPRATAEILLAHTLNIERLDLYLRFDQPLTLEELKRFKVLIKRRVQSEPVAYIIGVRGFWSMDLAVTGDVLIPRPETECLVEEALSILPEDAGPGAASGPQRVLDLGTGSGAIVLALAAHRPDHVFFAGDRSLKAVRLAFENAVRHRLGKTVTFFCGDWLMPLSEHRCRFDMIVSNPPYVPSRTIDRLQPEIFKYEPRNALDGGEDGLDSLRRIIGDAHRFMAPGGNLLLEIGHDQKAGVSGIIDECGAYEDVVFKKDYSGYDRVVRMRKKRSAP